VNESLLAVIALFIIGAAPVVVIDALIIRKVRRSEAAPATRTREDRGTDR
jgi:hypothetical protein